MTHRSRSGGPRQQFVQRKKNEPRPNESGNGKKGPLPTHEETDPAAAAEDDTEHTSSDDRHPLARTPTATDILALIRHSLASTISSPDFVPTIQKIKGLLYEKKWLDAFGDESLLEAYAGRWVPSRVLCFRELLADLEHVRNVLFYERGQRGGNVDVNGNGNGHGNENENAEAGPSRRRIVSLGGGAGSELLAIGSLIHGQQQLESRKEVRASNTSIEWVGVDYGPWTSVLDKLNKSLSELWSLDIPTNEHQMNLLDTPHPEGLIPLLQGDTKLVSILFTICELMSQSRQSTIRLLHTITTHLAPGGYLLVADSASDIAEFELGASGRKWPIYMVLDAVLMGMKDETRDGKSQWRKVDSVDSRWFRLGDGVGEGWPVKLENTRYWYRLYKRV